MDPLIILVLVLGIVFIILTLNSSTPQDPLKILYRQAARYAVAASQDEQPVIAVLHSNYAMGYLLAIKDLATAEEFKRATGKDLLNFEQELARIQDRATLKLVGACPGLVPGENPTLLEAMYAT